LPTGSTTVRLRSHPSRTTSISPTRAQPWNRHASALVTSPHTSSGGHAHHAPKKPLTAPSADQRHVAPTSRRNSARRGAGVTRTSKRSPWTPGNSSRSTSETSSVGTIGTDASELVGLPGV
jgi:hypothetical protein